MNLSTLVAFVLLCYQHVVASPEAVANLKSSMAVIKATLDAYTYASDTDNTFVNKDFASLIGISGNVVEILSTKAVQLSDGEVGGADVMQTFTATSTSIYEWMIKVSNTRDNYTAHKSSLYLVLAQIHARLFAVGGATADYKNFVKSITVNINQRLFPNRVQPDDDKELDNGNYPPVIDGLFSLQLFQMTSYLDKITIPEPSYSIQEARAYVRSWSGIVLLMDYIILASDFDFGPTNYNYIYFTSGTPFYLNKLQKFLTNYPAVDAFKSLNAYITQMYTEHFTDYEVSGPSDPVRTRLTTFYLDDYVYLVRKRKQ